MNTTVKLNKCKCGETEKVLNKTDGSWVYCPKRRWFNFWRHSMKTQIAWYPHDYTVIGKYTDLFFIIVATIGLMLLTMVFFSI